MNQIFAQQTKKDRTEELLLLDLFMELRKAGLSLGIDEYKLLQKALQAGFGTDDLPSLNRLCQAIWVKSPKDKSLYDPIFRKLVRDKKPVLNLETPNSTSSTPVVRPDEQSSPNTKSQTPQSINESKPNEATPELVDEKSKQETSSLNNTTSASKDNKPEQGSSSTSQGSSSTSNADDTQVRSDGDEIESSNTYYSTDSTDSTEITWNPVNFESIFKKIEDDVKAEDNEPVKSLSMQTFVVTGEYFPVTKRQMKQSWRYLRRLVRQGPAVELDLEATLKQVGPKGILPELVLRPPRVNEAELFLLLDRDGSMMPFHLLSRQLAETLLRGGRLGKASVYYFQNCPIEYLYRDCYRQEAVSIQEFLLSLHVGRSSVLIFSDAGAARGGYSKERVKSTKKFLDELKPKVRYVAWLNPMPKNFWEYTTAEDINKIVPMFEFSLRGLQDAIGVLRGRTKNIEGQRI